MKEKVVVIGGGGHAKVVIDILQRNNQYEITGCVDKDYENKRSILGIPYIGNDEYLKEIYKKGIRLAFIAIGDNKIRKELTEYVLNLKFKLINVVSTEATISPSVCLGVGNVIMPGVIINASSSIGNGCIINTNTCIDHDGEIGDFVHIAPGCVLAGSVIVRDNTFIGIGTRIIDKIGIGKQCIIGAGSVIVNNLPDNILAYGVPARIINKNK